MVERKFTTYSTGFKLAAVQQYLAGGKSYATLCKELDIKDTKTLRCWVKKFQAGLTLEETRGKTISSRRGRPRSKFASLEEEIAYLKAERDYLKKLYRSRFDREWGAE